MSVPGTRRLYWDDALALGFRARVAAHSRWGERDAVVLEATAFYPEAGGQLADHGLLAGRPVVDVGLDDAGVIHHVLEGERPAVGDEVDGEVDRARRRLHMALHTGQHLLSRALVEVARADTVSARLGEHGCTVDVDVATLGERALAEAEALVHAVIDDDVAVRAFFPTPEELARLPLRREPKVDADVRVIDIGGFDLSPCGGTHCTRSGQVGVVRVTGSERYKGKQRIFFDAGQRARVVTAGHDDALRALAVSFAVAAGDVPAAVERLRGEVKAASATARALKERLAEALAAGLSGERVVMTFDEAGFDVELLRAVAKRVVARDGAVALLAARVPGGVDVVVSRGAGSTFDCGAFVKRVAAASGGRGGGRPQHAEGRLPEGADWSALVLAHGG